MRPFLMTIGLALAAAACQTTDRGAPSESASSTASAPPAPAATGDQDGIDCALEIALACEDDEVDGCLTGQSPVHKCVSDGSTTTPSGIETVKLYDEPHALPEPSCDRFTELKLTKSQITLTNRLTGTCELVVVPDVRTFAVKTAPDGCGTVVYNGKSGNRSLILQDNTQRTCENVTLARITVEISDGAGVQRLYSGE